MAFTARKKIQSIQTVGSGRVSGKTVRRSKIPLIADGLMPRWGDSYAPGAAEPTLYVLPLPARP